MPSDLGKSIARALRDLERNGLSLPPTPEKPWTEQVAYEKMRLAYYFHDSFDNSQRFPNGGCTFQACITSCCFFPSTGRIRVENGKMIVVHEGEVNGT